MGILLGARGRLAAMLGATWLGLAGSASADPLDPTKFASLGSLTGNASIAIDTNNGTLAPTIIVDGSTYYGQDFTLPTGGRVAVFDFDEINLSGLTVNVAGSIPLFLLSRDQVTVGPSAGIVLDAGQVGGGAGGANVSNGAGPGGGGGTDGGGGGFGGAGGGGGAPPYGNSTAGGAAYGNLAVALQGGSGGGGGVSIGGGGGGGAIEIDAINSISIAGSISAAGGAGNPNTIGTNSVGGGGGSGGAITLAANAITLSSTLDVAAGAGGAGSIGGGGGGGGRILAEVGSGGLDLDFAAGTPSFDVGGGAGGHSSVQSSFNGIAGGAGTVNIDAFPSDPVGPAAVPEPASLASTAAGLLLAALGRARARRRGR